MATTMERKYRHTISALSNDDIFNDLDGPYPGFQGHDIFEVEYLKKVRHRDKAH